MKRFSIVAVMALLYAGGCSLYFGPGSESEVDPDRAPDFGAEPDDVGTGDGVTPPVPDGQCSGHPAQPVILDCDTAAGYEASSYRDPQPGGTALHVVGIYQTHGEHSGNNHPMGRARVNFALPGSNVLVLSSYEPVTWNVELARNAGLERIVVFGYHEQVVDAPRSIPVEIHDYDVTRSPLVSCGYSLPYDGQGCDTDELIANAELVTGLTLSSFDGCYDASQFQLAAGEDTDCR